MTHVVHVAGGSVLPAEVDEGIVGLLDVHLTFAFVGGHRAALHGHLACTELHQVLAGGAPGARHHAGEQSSRGHDGEDEWLTGGTKLGGGRREGGVSPADWRSREQQMICHHFNVSFIYCACEQYCLY